jgi:hypothetical protein
VGLLKLLVAAAALLGVSTASAQNAGCRAMLNGAPESVLRLEAVRSCRGADAACGYVQPGAAYGVLTMICPESGVMQVFGADRLKSLRLHNGTVAGECRSGSGWRDTAIPGCYP